MFKRIVVIDFKVKKEVRKMKKLICIGLFVAFTFLTGGIKYSYKIEHHAASLNLIWKTHKEEIRVFGFFRERYGEESDKHPLEFRKVSYGWSLHPSLKIFSISRE